MGKQILQAVEGDGSVKLLRIRTTDGRPCPLFRLIQADGSLNYHEHTLVRHPDGEVVTEDILVYATGEPISQTVRWLLIPALTANPGLNARGKIDPQELETLTTVGELGKAVRGGDPKSAVAAYRKLPKKTQEQKPVLIHFMQAAMSLDKAGEADYLASIETYRTLYPDDPAVDFVSIDYYFLKKDFAGARRSIDELDKAVGGDPYLDVMHGNAWMEAGQPEEARRAFERAIEREPDLATAYRARITLSLREKKPSDTLKWLRAVVENRDVTVGDLKDVPEYAEFVKSPQHGSGRSGTPVAARATIRHRKTRTPVAD
jgi:hypothetical protein